MESPPPSRSALLRELALVLTFGVLPMVLIGATLFTPSADEPPPPFSLAIDPGLRSGLMLTTYVLFFLVPAIAIRRSGQPLSHFGIRWRGPEEWTWGLGGFIANYLTGWVIWLLYWSTNFPLGTESIRAFHYFHVSSFGEMIATWPYYLLVVFAEEQMARCYLITRFRDLTGSNTFAVLGAAALFCGWHMFWGAAGMLHVFKAGVIFGLMFVRTGSVASAAIAHFVYDALALLPK